MKKTIEEKRLDFLNEMISYYSEDTSRRSISEESFCRYRTDDGKMCAIGRHIAKSKYSEKIEDLTVNSYQVFCLLPKRVKILGKHFLNHVQSLHDTDKFWDKKGVTEVGYLRINLIKELYCTKRED